MLVLTRKVDESIDIETTDGTVSVMVTKIDDRGVRLGISAPDQVDIWRSEVPRDER